MANAIITYRKSFQTKARGFRRALKDAGQAMFRKIWHPKFAPKHFKVEAYRRYPQVYKVRFKKIVDAREGVRRQGQKRFVPRPPMVHTGTLRRNVTTFLRVSGTARSVSARLPGSNVANFHTGANKRTGGYNMVKELRYIRADEGQEMADLVDHDVTDFFNRPKLVVKKF